MKLNRPGMSLIALVAVSLCVSACGNRKDLRPQEGAALPPAPYGRATSPTASELLEASTQARRESSVELRTRSEERQPDPFDLPPEQN
jgi:hypothetical protein